MDGIYFSLIFYEPISYLCHALEQLCEEYNEGLPRLIVKRTMIYFRLAVIGLPIRGRSLTLPVSSKRFTVRSTVDFDINPFLKVSFKKSFTCIKDRLTPPQSRIIKSEILSLSESLHYDL